MYRKVYTIGYILSIGGNILFNILKGLAGIDILSEEQREVL